MTNTIEVVLTLLTKAFGKRRYATVIICLVLMAFGVKNGQIREKLGTSYTTLRKYRTSLESGHIDELFEFKGARTKSELDDYEDIILKSFDKKPPKTLRDAQERIQKLTGLKRSLHRTRIWLKKRALEVEQ